jgi:LysM repeat protein
MREFLNNKSVIWLFVLSFIAVLQGIAISRDTLPAGNTPYFSMSEDFQLLKMNLEKDRKNLLSATVSTGEKAPTETLTEIESIVEDTELSAEDIIDLEDILQKVREVAKTESNNEPVKEEKVLYHEVKRGETLGMIARKYRMPLSQLILFNDIRDPDRIHPGYRLKIDFEPEFTHVVRDGESLWAISRLYNVPVESIREWNKLQADMLYPEQSLKIVVTDLSEQNAQNILDNLYRKSPFNTPLKGRITSRFGPRTHPITKKQHNHKGLDIAAPTGSPIKASDSGTVTFAGNARGYGKLIIIEHGRGYSTLYGHCSELEVKKGQKVQRGQTIGLVGATGLATGPHLHFEIRRYQEVLDPSEYI